MTNCCPRCLRNWEYVTSGPLGIGGLVLTVHPPGPCVPPAPVVYEPEAICEKCGKGFDCGARGRKACDECQAERKLKVERQRRRKLSRVRREPPRPCVSCDTVFQPRVLRQEQCGSIECKRTYWREYQKKRRAWAIPAGQTRKMQPLSVIPRQRTGRRKAA